ncbi:uncharacterized protein LOC135335830 isoform X4 [Halichondria panicea]|uniref:uncharacterized protein LOC135335830 isoform X4 n=1 Tax=Halichondria panicea TaxID=6063 RepID=UPI00312B60AE
MSDNLAKQLYLASRDGCDQEVLELLQRGAPPDSIDCYTRWQGGYIPLHKACAYNRLRIAELLIKFGAIVTAADNGGWTPLHSACYNNSKDTAKLLLEHHCPTDIKNSGGQTAAHWARLKGYRALADYVEEFQPGPRDPLPSYPTLEQLSQLECDQWLQLGVRLGLSNDQLETIKESQHPTAATLQAAKIKNIDMQWKDIVEALVSVGEYKLAESVCTQQGEGESTLSVSAFYGWLDWVKRLVETVGLNPKGENGTVNKAGDTPLSLACANGHLDTVKYLVNEHHCDPGTVNKAGDTPLSLACANAGHLDTVKYLVNEHHCDPRSTVNKAGDTPLSLAYKGGHWEVVKYLAITHHCDTTIAVNKAGDTPLSIECSRGYLEMVKAIINKHVDPNKPFNKAGDTPLSLAYKCGHWEVVRYLAITHHCDTTIAVNEAGDTPLSLECYRGNLEMVKALINKHVDPNKLVNKAGDTPLSLACANGHLDTVKYLVNEHHCDPRKPVNKAGDTPLSLAYQNRHLETIKYLAQEHQCDPKFAVNEAGDTPLSLECYRGNLEMVKALINKHVDPNKLVNKAGDTPLSLACANGHLDTVKYLVNEHHCDPRKPVNKAGDTPLSLAYQNRHLETIKYLAQEHQCDPKFAVNEAGDTPLSLECYRGNLEMVKALINKHVDPNKLVNKAGDTPLSLACANGHLDTVKYLVNEHHCDPRKPVNKAGDTPLALAYQNRHLETIKYLAQEHQCDPKFAVNKAGDTPLSLECSHGNLDIVKALINKHVDPNKPVNKAGDTPLSLAYKGGHWEVVKYLAITHHCDATSVLLLAVKHNQNAIVEILLVESHSDPNVTDKEGKTPLNLSNDPEIIKLLLKHGAKAANVYKKHSKLIRKLSSERPPHLPLSVLIIGDGGVGKSTLLKSILSSKGFWSLFQKARPVDDVDARTVGIIPYEIYTKEFGRIIYFDFAGQKEFYTSHCAILENAVQTSPPIIILCAKLVESEQAIIDSMYRWLTLVQNQCTNLKGKAHVIVVGSHADQVKKMGEDPQAKESIFAPIIKQFPKFEITEFIPIDCRFADSSDMNIVRKRIQKSSAILRSPETISLNAHTFYIYLAENFKHKLAVSLKVVQQRIHSDLDQTHESEKMADILSFIPTTLNHLVDICTQLSKVGLLLFLYNKSSYENSFLICDSKKLLSDVTGTVFAPEHFRQHCKLASSTGVVPLSKFEEAFSNYDTEMLIAFMTHLELCFEIKDKQVLEYIQKMEPDLDDTRYLFFPGLIRIETPERVWEEDPSMSYHFGWILETSQNTHFYDPRCLQVLILRIVFTFGLAPASKVLHDIPSLQKFCSVWKSGICWCNDDGIITHLELCNNKSFTIKIRSEVLTPESLAHRSKVVSKVLETVKDVCPNIVVVESLINPQEVVSHPLKPSSELTLFSVRDLAAAVISQKEAVKSVHRPLSLKRLLQFEPYAGLDLNTLQCIHSDKNVMKDEKISNTFIYHFTSQISDPNSILMYRQMLSQSQASNVNIQSVRPKQEVVQALETWRSETEGTYSCLRETLNKYSVFAGRNPLDLAGVAHDDIDPSVFSISGDELTDHQIPSTPTLASGELSIDMNQKSTIREHNDTVSVVKTPSSDEGSLSSERLQHSAALVQRLGATSAGTGDSQLHRRGSSDLSALRNIVDTAITGQLEYQMKYGDAHIQDPGTTSVYELMVKHGVTDEQLDREIEQGDLAPVAMHFDNVELYLNPLKLNGNEQADVWRETYLSRSNQVAVITCLSIWRGHEPSEATFRALIRILLDLRKEELATRICQYLADGNGQVYTQRADKSADLKPDIMCEGSLSSERLQYSADLVQRVGATISSSTCEVHTRRGLSANRVTLQDLVSRYSLTDKQLNSEIGDSDIPYLAEHFNGVKSAMGLTPAQQADVNRLYCNEGTQVAMTECLILWKRHDPFAATYKALLELLLGLRKDEIADDICQHLSQ